MALPQSLLNSVKPISDFNQTAQAKTQETNTKKLMNTSFTNKVSLELVVPYNALITGKKLFAKMLRDENSKLFFVLVDLLVICAFTGNHLINHTLPCLRGNRKIHKHLAPLPTKVEFEPNTKAKTR
ncbi:MAG: hypothetical protein V5788_11785 [Shewanella sp.]